MKYFPSFHNVKQEEILNVGIMCLSESFKVDQNKVNIIIHS